MADQKNKSEADVQNLIRIEWSQLGGRCWRNNVGAFRGPTGQWVRYGLANDSKQMNQVIKSSDLIGFYPLEITAEMVGKTVPVLASIEVKEEGYKKPGRGKKLDHHNAQQKWCDMVAGYGGFSGIFDSAESMRESFEQWLQSLKQ